MDFDNVVIKDSPGLCRCCLSEGCYKDLGSEYIWMGEPEIYAEMLLECFDISISQHNNGPNGPNRLICEVCITRLRDACNFKKQVMDSERKFVDMLARGDFIAKVSNNAPMKAETSEAEAIEEDHIEVEYLENDMEYDYEDIKEEDSDGEIKEKPARASATSTRKAREEPKRKKTQTESKQRVRKTTKKGEYTEDDTLVPIYEMRKNLFHLFNYTTVVPFKWTKGKYKCFFCAERMLDAQAVQKHTELHRHFITEQMFDARIGINIKVDVSKISCLICEEPFRTIDELTMHLVFKHTVNYNTNILMYLEGYALDKLICTECDKNFTDFANLMEHVHDNHTTGFICYHCGESFHDKSEMRYHIRTHHRQRTNHCKMCSRKFTSKYQLGMHRAKVHGHKAHNCSLCPMQFETPYQREKHMSVHFNKGDFECLDCNLKFPIRRSLNIHITKYHSLLLPESSKISGEAGRQNTLNCIKRRNVAIVLKMCVVVPFKWFLNKFTCFYCSLDFEDPSVLWQHTRNDHKSFNIEKMRMRRFKFNESVVKIDISELACVVCGVQAVELDEMLDHIILVHGAKYDKTVGSCLAPFKLNKNNLPCPNCDETFKFFGHLLHHLNKNHPTNCFMCDTCGQCFNKMPNLRTHKLIYHKAGGYKCSQCELTFPSKLGKMTHEAKVHSAAIARCGLCGEKFTSQYLKQKHMVEKHNVEHKCSFCGKLFHKNSTMLTHVRRIHLKERNVPCELCGLKFFDKTLLKLHMVKHAGQRNFRCEICNKTFLWYRNLKSHMNVHKAK